MSIIGANELIFHTDPEKGIHSGGFSVQSILEKSPIITQNQSGGGTQDMTQVSDLFHQLVIPSGLLSYFKGGDNGNEDEDDEDDDDDDNDADNDDEAEEDNKEDLYYGGAVIENDLYDKLLDLVKPTMTRPKTRKNKQQQSKRKTKKNTPH